jgi:rhamnosyltransferase
MLRMISVVIPTRNGGEDLRACLDALATQKVDDDHELVIVDSGSADGSLELARKHGARVHEIAPYEFDHGGTRNLGASLARGETLVFLSQDARPERPDWLATLVGRLEGDAQLAGVYGRQLPQSGAKPPERYFLDFLYGPEARVQRISGPGDVSMETVLFSNVNAAIRRSAWEALPFADDLIMSEDQDWCRRVLLAGGAVAYEPRAVVRHSHPYTVLGAFRRFFDSGVSAERAYLAAERPSSRVLRAAALRYATGELSWLVRSGQARWIPYAAVYEAAKFAGLQLGARHRRLPLWLKLRCTMSPGYWTGPALDPYLH